MDKKKGRPINAQRQMAIKKLASNTLEYSKCCGVIAERKNDGVFECSGCGNVCELEPRDWRWWVNADGTDSTKLYMLKQAFAEGTSDLEACVYADITQRQLYYYQKVTPDFVTEKERLKATPVLEARKTTNRAIKGRTERRLDKNGDLIEVDVPPNEDIAFRFLTCKAKDEFSTKQILQHEGGVDINQGVETELSELLKNATAEQRADLLNVIDRIQTNANTPSDLQC